jgi:flagellar basal body-associated protein FliL
MEEHKTKEKPDKKLWIMVIALGLLIVVAGVQAIELVGLKNKVNTELTGLSIAKPTSSSSSGSSTLQKNLQNLPSMVGGC